MSGAPDGSPVGSPSAAQQLDGAAVAMQMVQATTAAAEAASAAVAAVQGLKSTIESSSTDEKAWYRLLPKPGSFDPGSREDEIAKWRDWSWSFEQYVGTLDPNFVTEIERIRKTPAVEVDMSIMASDEQKRCIFLYSLLASVLKNRPLVLLKSVKDFNGYECYRELIASNEPQNKNRSMSLLNAIMNWPSFSNKASLLAQVMKLEAAFNEYDRLGTALSEELRSAVLLRCLVGQIKTWIQLQLTDSTTYLQIRESVLSYERSTTRWSETMVLGFSNSSNSADTSAPMEVDRIKGKSKGKGKLEQKGKGKNKSDGKGKGKSEKGKSWNNNGKGQNQWDSGKGHGWSSSSVHEHPSKGKGKSKDKGKQKSDQTECYRCGKLGHKARDCRVRLVGEGSGDATGTSTQPNADTATTHGTASATQHVKRVMFSTSSSLPCNVDNSAFFDISDGSDACSPIVRMIARETGETGMETHGDAHLREMFHEYSLKFSGDGTATYEMQTLPQVDDMEHFITTVARDYRFELYEVDTAVNSTFNRCFCDFQCFQPACQQHSCQPQRFLENQHQQRSEHLFQHQPDQRRFHGDFSEFWSGSHTLSVRAVSSGHDIVLDSGSDATVLPLYMNHAGTPNADQDSRLRDAQGNAIQVDSVKDICFDLQTEDGRTVTIRDTAHFSNAVDSPIISYGKLLRSGWGIIPEDTGSFLTHARGFKIPMNFRNNSLTIHGHVRVIESYDTVRVIHVDIPSNWQSLESGWWELGDNMMIYVSGAQKFVDVTDNVLISEWPFRTTIAWSESSGWCVLELCEKIFDMDNLCKQIGQPFKRLLTIVTKYMFTTDEFGMVLKEGPGQSVQGSVESKPATSGAVASQDVQMSEPVQKIPTVVKPASEIPMTVDATLGIQSEGVTIAGVKVFPTSSIALLRASCKNLEISQSGSKHKLWNRILAHLDKLKVLEEVEIAQNSLQEVARDPTPVQTAEKPENEEEIKRHQLTHTPYAAWCEACVQGKGRAERHETDTGRLQDRELPSLSFDFAYTGRSCESVEVDSTTAKLTTLIFHDSHSGAVHCVPVFAKNQRKHMVMEAVRFLQFLGHSDICLRCDQEPAILAVQNLLQRTWQRMGHRAVIENSKLLDHASNSWVEKAVDNVRNMSSVLLHELSKRLNYEIPVGHPLFSWAFIHACWIRNRFGVRAGVTSYELIRGHVYRGRLCQFAEPVMCFIGDTTQHKGDPKWKPGIFLTKSVTNDMFLVQCEGNLRLTRSVKSIFKDWSEHMELYRSLLTFPWQIEGVLGNRVKPVSKSYLGVPGAIPGIDDEAASDPEEEEQVGLGADNVEASLHSTDGSELTSFPVTPLVPLAPRTPMPETPAEVHVAKRTPPPPTAVVAAQVGEGAEQAGPMEIGAASSTRFADAPVEGEPDAKRQKTTVRRIGDEEFMHVDMDVAEYFENVEHDGFLDEYFETGSTADDEGPFADDECLWQPFSELEPNLSPELLAKIDEYGDKVEIMRLTSMNVITTPEE